MADKPLDLGSWESSHTNQQVRVFVCLSVSCYTIKANHPKSFVFGYSYLLIWLI